MNLVDGGRIRRIAGDAWTRVATLDRSSSRTERDFGVRVLEGWETRARATREEHVCDVMIAVVADAMRCILMSATRRRR